MMNSVLPNQNPQQGTKYDAEMYNQMLQDQQQLSAQQIEQQRIPFQNTYRAEARIERPGTQSPNSLDTGLGIAQLVVLLFTIIIAISQPEAIIIFVIVHIGLVVARFFTSQVIQFYSNVKYVDDVKEYHAKMLQASPRIEYTAESYHIKRTGRHGRNKKKVVSHSEISGLQFHNVEDHSNSINDIFKDNNYVIRLESKFVWHRGNQLAENNWNLLVQQLLDRAQGRDKHYEGKDTSKMEGMIPNIMILQSDTKAYLSPAFAYVIYCLGFSLIFDRLFFMGTAGVQIQISKTVFCHDIFSLNMQAMQGMQQPIQQQPMQQQPMQQNIPIQQQPQQPMQPMMQQQQQQPMYQEIPIQQQQQQQPMGYNQPMQQQAPQQQMGQPVYQQQPMQQQPMQSNPQQVYAEPMQPMQQQQVYQ